jgi:hypothetical protein
MLTISTEVQTTLKSLRGGSDDDGKMVSAKLGFFILFGYIMLTVISRYTGKRSWYKWLEVLSGFRCYYHRHLYSRTPECPGSDLIGRSRT